MNFTYVQQPNGKEELEEYIRKIGMLSTDRMFLFFLSRLQHRIMSDFANGEKVPDFYKGQMALVGEIISESKAAIEAGTKHAV